MAGQCFLVVTAPVSAHEMITLSSRAIAVLPAFANRPLHVLRDLLQDRDELRLVARVERLEGAMKHLPRRDRDLARDGEPAVGGADRPDAAILLRLPALDEPGFDHPIDDAGHRRVLRGDAL